MNGKSTFDRLVAELTTNERLEMLKGIEGSYSTDDEPLLSEPQAEETESIEFVYSHLGVLRRLVLYVRALFSHRDVVEILEDAMLRGFAYDVEHANRELFDARTRSLTSVFAQEIKLLRDSLSCFVEPLSRAFGPEKKDFIAFLAGFEIPLHQDRLLEITDPMTQAGESELATESDIRRQMLLDVAASLKDISEPDRATIYGQVRSLYFLNELVCFPFTSIIEHFGKTQGGNPVPLQQLKGPLVNLGDVLFSQDKPPNENALKALFLFDPDLKEEVGPEQLEAFLRRNLEDAHEGIARIREFGSIIPFRKLLKICTGNLSYTSEHIGGGEDWFALYRLFWEDRAEKAVTDFAFRNRKNGLLHDACTLLRIDQLFTLPHYPFSSADERFPGRYETTVAFIHQFLELLFMREMYRVLKIFLVDGDFYKSQNRQQFTDSYEGLRDTAKAIGRLNADLAPEGGIGLELSAFIGRVKENASVRNRLSAILEAVDVQAEKIITSVRENLLLLINVVKGILHGESGGRFDTLSNISYIGGSENAKLLDRLGKVLKQAQEAGRIINEMYDLERTTRD